MAAKAATPCRAMPAPTRSCSTRAWGGVDHIADFHRKEGDRIHLDDAVFTKLKVGVLKKKAFEIGEEADSRKDRIIYDKEDGIVRYDDDGSGKHKAKIIAVLDDAASLKAGDILVI